MADNFNEISVAEDDSVEEVYEVYTSNPVCPCCGKKLIIIDDSNDEDSSLVTPLSNEINESINAVHGTGRNDSIRKEMASYIENAAQEIYDAYMEDIEEYEGYDEEDMKYITNNKLLNAIARKAIELNMIFKENYKIFISKDLLKVEIRRLLQNIS